LPPFLVLAVDRMYRRMKDHPAIEGFVAGLGLAVVGVSVVGLVGLLRSVGADIASVLITLASLALGRRLPVAVVLGLAGLAGIVLR
jgi:chromate transport protein ChrA